MGIIWKMKRRLSKGLWEAGGKKQREEAKMQPLAKDLDILICRREVSAVIWIWKRVWQWTKNN